jgi:type IV pilus biogenesis protein CpaD/CtpE
MWVFPQDFRCRRGAATAGLCMMLAGCGGELASPVLFNTEPASCSAQLGCTTEHNIAAVVDRPADLVTPRKDKPRDAVRRDGVLSAWRGSGLELQAPAPHQASVQP